jgi:uncharacterized protein YggE
LRNWCARRLFEALAVLTFAVGLGDVGRADAPACARPNVPATTIHAVEPVVPGIAQRSNVGGQVRVVVALDAGSHVVGARIATSTNALLDGAALDAARASVFQTEIRDCGPVASEYVFAVSFAGGAGVASGGTVDAPLVSITVTGSAARAPDVAFVYVTLVSADDASPAAVAHESAAYDAFIARLRGLGIGSANVDQRSYGVQYNPTPGPSARPFPYAFPTAVPRFGYVVTRQLAVTVAPLERVGGVVAAAIASGATALSVQYTVSDAQAAYREALALAMRDAAVQAEAIAAASRLHVDGITYVETGKNLRLGSSGAPPQQIRIGPPGTVTTAPLPPSAVYVVASAIVTYALKH